MQSLTQRLAPQGTFVLISCVLYFDVLLAALITSTSVHQISTSSPPSQQCARPCTCSFAPTIHVRHSLRTVDCSHSNLTSIPSVPFDTEVLILRDNRISDLLDVVPELSNLIELDVSLNRLSNLGRGHVFRNMSHLLYLNLSKNKLCSIYHEVFRNLVNLQGLSLADNRLSLIETLAFRSMYNLRGLDLSSNQLSAIYVEWFAEMTHLTVLNVAGNRIHYIKSAVLRPLRSLEEAFFQRNRIFDISDDAFVKLFDLKTLHLGENKLTSIPYGALRPMSNLRILHLSGNPISRIQNGAFSHLQLQELHLNWLPELIAVDAKAMHNMTNLMTLQMHNNAKLMYLDPNSIADVPKLKELFLHNNNLQTLPRSFVEVFPPGIFVSLFGNPLRCDCNIRWIRRELSSNQSKINFTDPSHIQCGSPNALAGKVIRDLDIKRIAKECAPTVLTPLNGSLYRKLGDRLTFDCRGLGIPEPVLSWQLPGGRWLNQSTNDIRFMLKPAGSLTFYHLKEEDTGSYTCVAENELGSSHVTSVLRVRRIDINLFPVGVASTYVTLVWNGTARNSLPNYVLLYKAQEAMVDATQHRVVSPLPRSYTIHDLQPETNYEFCISYKDEDGRYVRLSCTAVRTQDELYMRQGIRRTSNVAVGIVLGIVAAMLMVICMVTTAARKYRHSEYENADKPTVVNSLSQIPLDNLYSPLISNIGS